MASDRLIIPLSLLFGVFLCGLSRDGSISGRGFGGVVGDRGSLYEETTRKQHEMMNEWCRLTSVVAGSSALTSSLGAS